MEKCQKCNGVMLEMKSQRRVMGETQSTQSFKCSRCGNYLAKRTVYTNGKYELEDERHYLKRR